MASVKGKVYKGNSTLLIHRDKASGGVTTLNGAVAAGATSITLAANPSTAFGVGDTIRIGEGNEMEVNRITAVASLVMTLAFPLTYAHASGDPVVEMVSYDFGDVEAGGFTATVEGETQDIPVSTKRLAYTILDGYKDVGGSFALPNLAVTNFPLVFGMLPSVVQGAGTLNVPFAFVTDGNQFAADPNIGATLIGVLMDGTVHYTELWGVDVDYTGASITMARGQLASLPVKMLAAAGGVTGQGAPGYTVDTSLRPTKGKVLVGLNEVGIIGPAGSFSQTVAGASAAAGQKVVQLSAVTGLSVGDLLKLGASDQAEWHEVGAISAPNITLRTPLLRTQAVGTTVVSAGRTPFAGVSEEGVKLDVSGSIDKIRVATSGITQGTRPGAAVMTLSFATIEISLSQIAYALGIAQAQIVSSRLPFNGNNIGRTPAECAYLKGLLDDGTVLEIRAWACAQSIQSFAMQMTNQGTLTSLPFTLRPTSGLLVQNGP